MPEVQEERKTQIWMYNEKEAKSLKEQAKPEGPTLSIAQMEKNGVASPVVKMSYPVTRASEKAKHRLWEREGHGTQSANTITLRELAEDKLMELLVTSRKANTGDVHDLLGMVINADSLFRALITTLKKHSKPEWECYLAQTFYMPASVGDQMVVQHTYVNADGNRLLSPIGRENNLQADETPSLLSEKKVKDRLI